MSFLALRLSMLKKLNEVLFIELASSLSKTTHACTASQGVYLLS